MNNTKNMVVTGVLSGIASVLMFIEFPLPFFPPFLQLDFGDIPAVLASFALGPVSGVTVELVKSVIHVFATKSMGVGEIASFICGTVFVVITGTIYQRARNRKNAILSMLLSTFITAAVAALVNLYFLLPVYSYILGIDAQSLLKMASVTGIRFSSVAMLVWFAVFPFNIVKWLAVSFIVYLSYKKLSKIIHR